MGLIVNVIIVTMCRWAARCSGLAQAGSLPFVFVGGVDSTPQGGGSLGLARARQGSLSKQPPCVERRKCLLACKQAAPSEGELLLALATLTLESRGGQHRITVAA